MEKRLNKRPSKIEGADSGLGEEAVLRSMEQFEAEQINRRINSLVIIQGLLFSTAGFSWGKEIRFSLVICFVGISIAVISFLSLLSPILAMRNINSIYQNLSPERKSVGIFGYYPGKNTILTFFSPDNFLPVIFVFAWVLVLFLLQ